LREPGEGARVRVERHGRLRRRRPPGDHGAPGRAPSLGAPRGTTRRVSRRGALAASTAGAAGLLAWAAWIEPRRTVVRRHVLHVPNWSRDLDGLRVALVSDLHAGAPHIGVRRVAEVAELVSAQRADLVCLLGDFVDPEVTFGRP